MRFCIIVLWLGISYTASADYLIVQRNGNMRAEASTDSEILEKVHTGDTLILLDENGKQFSSVEFASQLQRLLTTSNRKIIFMTGGAYGFGSEIIKRASLKISFSKLTFTHQMIRPMLLEQVYRAFTIINNEKYHH